VDLAEAYSSALKSMPNTMGSSNFSIEVKEFDYCACFTQFFPVSAKRTMQPKAEILAEHRHC
jgi:hypothetical protein